MKIVVAKGSGFCFGVKRAVNMAYKAVTDSEEKGGNICSLGSIIHNPQVVSDLEKHGVRVISSIDEAENIENCCILFRSHGTPDPSLFDNLRKKGITVVDATCPYVKKAQIYAQKLVEEGYYLVIIGNRHHPEIESILGYCNYKALVTELEDELKYLKGKKKVGIIAQTTQSRDKFGKMVLCVLSEAEDIKILNTICNATSVRQSEAKKLAEDVDVMIVIGGRNSANTTRLVEVCKEINDVVYHIETDEEIQKSWFHNNVVKVGVTGGASTPGKMIEKVVARLKEI